MMTEVIAQLKLHDRADGVKGHYCIGRPMRDHPAFTEYWNPSGWAGSGYLFTDEKLVQSVLDLIAEVERLREGRFTPEEFQNLCHNTEIAKGFEAFADGCEDYQRKLFGRCRRDAK